MSIEKINAAQQAANTQQKELAREEKVKTQIESKGSTKDIVAALGVLASIGIATVAIIKSKNAKKELQEALKKAEEEKKKLADEAKKAAEDAKKAAEDVNKKVEEAVDNAKQELKNKLPKYKVKKSSGSGRRTGYKAPEPKPKTPKVETPKAEAPKAPEAPKVEAPKVEEPKVETPKVETPKAPETPSAEAPKVEEPKAPETPKPSLLSRVRGWLQPKPKTPKVETPKAETPKVEEPKVETPKVETPKAEAPKAPEAPKVEEPKAEAPKVGAPKAPETPKVETPKAEAPKAPEAPKVEAPKAPEAPKAEAPKVEVPEVEAPKVETPKVEEPKVEAPKAPTGGTATPPPKAKPLSNMSEEELLTEYNALKDIVKKLGDSDPAVQRFLAVQGELVNKRSFRVTKDGIAKRESTLDTYTREVLEQEAAAKKAIEESDARNAQWVAEQNAKREAEYEKMYLQAEREYALNHGAKELEGGNIDVMLDEVYPGYTRQFTESYNDMTGIVIPRTTRLSNAIQRATDYVSEKFGKLRGLFRRKKVAPVEQKPEPIVVPKVEEPKVEIPDVEVPKVEAPKAETQKVEAPKAETQKVEAPKAETQKVEAPKAETQKVEAPKAETQKVEAPKVEAPKVETSEVKVSKTEAPITTVAKIGEEEYQGLNELERLLVERDGQVANEYGKNKERIAEINEQLAAMGKADAKLEQTEANTVRIDIARQRAEQQHWSTQLTEAEKEKTELVQQLESKGLKPIEATDEEIELQVKFVSDSESSVKERLKGDIEWAEKYENYAQESLDELSNMGKLPIDRTTEDMQTQFRLFQVKDSINRYTRWIAECNASVKTKIAKLKDLLQGSEGVSKKK